ncbi:MAG: fibronectin type III domain-containing protein [Candidatus Roizmanbacteria bacterium]|nr:fibronectin type III domain-containing protein [Candidatus Roizmanbacteria bacterium]
MMRIKYVLFVLVFLFMTTSVYASDISINCNSNACSNEKLGLFGSTKNWYPGMWVKKTLEVKNTNSKDSIFVKIKPIEQELDTSSCQLEKQMILSVFNSSSKTVLWGGSLRDFYSNVNAVPLSLISAKNTQEYSFIISFNQESPDECQNSSTSFGLDIYLETSEGSQMSTLCEDIAPQKAPELVSVMQDAYGFTLNWQPAQDPVSYYSIAYGSTTGSYTAFNTNAGGHDTTSYALSGLDKDKQYYFAIQAGNGCSVSSYSNEVSINVPTPQSSISTDQITKTLSTSEQTDSVDNVSTVSDQSPKYDNSQPTPTGSVLGESVSKTPQKKEGFLKNILQNNNSNLSNQTKKNKYILLLIPIFLLFLFLIPKRLKK